jgi:thiol-disulfide isomerase/thioredoxin
VRVWRAAIILPTLLWACGGSPEPEQPGADPESRIVRYLDDRVSSGDIIDVTELYSEVFTAPDEQAVLDRLVDTFFRIPLFIERFDATEGRPPTLEEIAGNFGFTIPGETDTILRVMESDPRIQSFFVRDRETGEITRVDGDAILNDPQFGQEIERTLAGWEGRVLPRLELETFDGDEIRSEDLSGRPYLLYVWFTNCPPCVQTSPLLVDLYGRYRDSGFEIVAANADRILGLPYDDQVRSDYVRDVGIQFVTAHLSEEAQTALGGILVFPTMFFVNREGRVIRHFLNFQEEAVLEDAVNETIGGLR